MPGSSLQRTKTHFDFFFFIEGGEMAYCYCTIMRILICHWSDKWLLGNQLIILKSDKENNKELILLFL